MGLPLIQVVVIAARQVSKPVADAVMVYGKNHPGFRQRILVPLGRYIMHMKTRLRMERLGLGKPVTAQQVTEAVALEEATEAVQQLVIFSYSVSVYAAYWAYTTWTSEPTVKLEKFAEYQVEQEKEITMLRSRIEELESRLSIKPKVVSTPPPENSSTTIPSSPPPVKKEPEITQKPLLQRISSYPLDTATRLIYGERRASE